MWFGPKRFGWGWGPVSWEGWAAIVGGGLVAAVLRQKGRVRAGQLLGLGVLVLCYLKGTEPGGRRKLEEFRAQTVGAAAP